MNDTTYDKKCLRKYLIWTFSIAWTLQIAVSIFYNNGFIIIGQLIMSVMMFVPLFGAFLSGFKLSNLVWKPRLKGNAKFLIIAWILPALFTCVGAALYFIVFPKHFDLSGNYLVSNAGVEALAELESRGISYPLFILISVVACLTYATFINMFLAVGEEVGWRGFMYPQLKAKYGKRKGWLIGGIVWGIWHWPLIWLIGYEYGEEYVGFPIVGMLVFCVFTVVMGILCDWLYEKSGCIWFPSIFHGSINAAATVTLAVCIVDTESMRLLGPAPVGVIAGIPFLVLGVILLLKANQK